MSCRVAMLHMHEDGLITIPLPRRQKSKPRTHIKFTESTASKPQHSLPVGTLPDLHMELIIHELERAQAGEWLPQALQARRSTAGKALAQLERQQAWLLEAYLTEVIGRDEFKRKRQELTKTQSGLTQQLRQLDLQAQKQIDTAKLAMHIQDFCQRI